MRKGTVAAGVTAALLLAGCSSGQSDTDTPSAGDGYTAPAVAQLYTYEIAATGESPTDDVGSSMVTVDITESTASGTTQHAGEYLPYTDTTTGAFKYISAQITNESGGEITCTIKDSTGNVVATNTASGFASIVTCQA